MAKRGARVGAAAVALGLSIAAPQAAAVASADTGEQDAGQAPAATDSPPTSEQASPAKSRAARATAAPGSADRPGSRGPRPADPRSSASPVDATRPARHRPGQDQSGTGRPVATSTGLAAPSGGTPAPAVTGTATTAGANALPGTPDLTGESATGVGAPNAVAMVGAAVGRFFDSASSWIAQFPRNPITDFVAGALLMMRRGLIGFLSAIGSGASTGQVSATSPYLSEQELRTYLLELALQRYGSVFGQTVPQYDYGYKWLDGTLVPLSTPTGRDGTASDTNTQVDGVDEADFVETDGRYVYVSRNGVLSILDIDSNLASQTALSGYVVGQFLAGDRLTVISQSGGGWYGPMVRMAYGPWWDWNPQTTVTVFDISDRTAPVVAGQTVFDGSYRDARAVNGVVYVVTDRSLKIPEPLYTEVRAGDQAPWAPYARYGTQVESYRTYETWDAYVARVGDQITALSLPHAYSVDAEGNLVDLGVIAGGGQIVRPTAQDDQSVMTVVSIDSLNAPAGSGFASGVAALVGSGGATVYMTPDALYLATAQDHYSDIGSSTDTRIDRFSITGTEVDWQATGLVPGTLINQFAMDEQSGYLRVATHTWSSHWAGGTWATVNDSGVYVLDTVGNALEMVGSVTGLAPGEQLYAVRFLGDNAYLVTFLRTDPLFAIDLSDPAAPSVSGELVIPGFSNYLQPVGDGLLLGIGQEQEPGTWNTRMHVSLFGVGDSGDPTLIEREFLDESAQWSWSEAQFDHHALLYSAQDGLLVVPVAASGYDPQTGDYTYRQTLQVLRIDAGGVTVLGAVDAGSPVLRTVRIGDVLYAVCEDHVSAYSLTDFSEVGRTPLGNGQQSDVQPVLA